MAALTEGGLVVVSCLDKSLERCPGVAAAPVVVLCSSRPTDESPGPCVGGGGENRNECQETRSKKRLWLGRRRDHMGLGVTKSSRLLFARTRLFRLASAARRSQVRLPKFRESACSTHPAKIAGFSAAPPNHGRATLWKQPTTPPHGARPRPRITSFFVGCDFSCPIRGQICWEGVSFAGIASDGGRLRTRRRLCGKRSRRRDHGTFASCRRRRDAPPVPL